VRATTTGVLVQAKRIVAWQQRVDESNWDTTAADGVKHDDIVAVRGDGRQELLRHGDVSHRGLYKLAGEGQCVGDRPRRGTRHRRRQLAPGVFQSAAVNAYIAKQPSAISSNVYLYPPGMRAVPDVAALASELLLVTGGVRSMIYGTSGSAPIVAAFVSLANNAKSRAQQQHTGTGIAQIHAMLYGQNNVILRDVTVGDNCPGEQYGQWIANFPDFGATCYNASVGWDAVTGLGTLNVSRLVELAATWVAPPPPPTPTPTPKPPASTAAPGTPRPPTPPPTPKPKPGPPHTHAPVDNSDSSSSSCSGSNATDDDGDDDPHAKSKTTVYVACAASIGGCIVIVMATIFLRRRADARRRAMAVAGGGGMGSATPFVAPDEEARTAADSVAPYTPVASASPPVTPVMERTAQDVSPRAE
jgi:hypothetical protein